MNAGDAGTIPACNKTLAQRFLLHCFRGERAELLALLDPQVTWWTLGDPQQLRVAGTRDLARITRMFDKLQQLFPHGMDVSFEGVTAENDRVALEAVSLARMADGKPYSNRYHFLVQVRDGRVVQVREYFDTLYAHGIQQASPPTAS